MARINNVSFAIDADHLHDRASISVSCDIEFTDVEVNAINMLGLRYRVQCLIEAARRAHAAERWTDVPPSGR